MTSRVEDVAGLPQLFRIEKAQAAWVALSHEDDATARPVRLALADAPDRAGAPGQQTGEFYFGTTWKFSSGTDNARCIASAGLAGGRALWSCRARMMRRAVVLTGNGLFRGWVFEERFVHNAQVA